MAARLAGLAGALVLAGLAVAVATPLAVETSIMAAVADARSATLTDAAHLITALGDLWLVGMGLLVLVVALRRRDPAWTIRSVVLLDVVGSWVIVGILKWLVARPRPTEALVTAFSPAYPSGHAARAAAVYGLAAWLCHRHVRRAGLRWLGVAAALVLMVAVAGSRVYLGVHLPSEVAVGLLIGLTWLGAVLYLVPMPARP